jgi:hypothetical protein
MIAGTLSRYFGMRFLTAVLAVFAGTLVLTAMIDYLELMRRTGDLKDVSGFFVAKITLFRVPFVTERVLPFAVLGARGRARRRHVGVAVHRARRHHRLADRRRRDDGLQSDLGEPARAVDAPRSRAVRP